MHRDFAPASIYLSFGIDHLDYLVDRSLTPAIVGVTTNCMARKKTETEKLRGELFTLKRRQFDDQAEHKRLVGRLDRISGGESPILREQRRWNSAPPLLPQQVSI